MENKHDILILINKNTLFTYVVYNERIFSWTTR